MLKDKRILLIGDRATDRYHWGHTRDYNPESPVPILDLERSEDRPGMAHNVYENLLAFTPGEIKFIPGEHTSIKTRYMDIRSRRCLLRVDRDHLSSVVVAPKNLDNYDTIVISDYNKGSVTLDLIRQLRCEFSGPIFVDTKIRDLAALKGCTVKINQREWCGRTSDHDDVIVTLGEHGAMYQGHTYPTDPAAVYDVCGAGDIFLAALAAGWLMWQDMPRSIGLAMAASAIAVQHLGTYVLTTDDARKICGY